MSTLVEKSCKPCEGGTQPLDAKAAGELSKQLDKQWQLSAEAKSLRREWKFKNFYRTMSFVNAVAHIANSEDHHPDMIVEYGRCVLTFTTHAIKGLSENDFIAAAKVDRLGTE